MDKGPGPGSAGSTASSVQTDNGGEVHVLEALARLQQQLADRERRVTELELELAKERQARAKLTEIPLSSTSPLLESFDAGASIARISANVLEFRRMTSEMEEHAAAQAARLAELESKPQQPSLPAKTTRQDSNLPSPRRLPSPVPPVQHRAVHSATPRVIRIGMHYTPSPPRARYVAPGSPRAFTWVAPRAGHPRP
mmetsp:Transcript_57420/g.133854  ORF Transcript_57420/g.133854 Transcript_57420/m.133854 type:complete len:197 (-) Transcript_57420:98-688(-)